MSQALAVSSVSYQFGYVSKELMAVFERVLKEAPGSIRELARQADVSHALLIRVRDGDLRLTPETVEAIVAVLRTWEDRCHELADALEDAARNEGGHDGR